MEVPDCPFCGSSDTHVQAIGRKEYRCENEDAHDGGREFGKDTLGI